MLKKTERLSKQAFDTYYKTGKRIHTSHLQLIYTPHASFHGAVVVGKKVFKKAVDRNRLRRQLYSRLYTWKQSSSRVGVFIVIAKPSIKNLPKKDFTKELQALVGRL
ncbi:MAG: ribonuclease P protein component [Patescibacteria group bacterium]